MRRREMGTRGKAFLRVFLVALLFLVASWLLFIGIVANRTAEKRVTVTVSTTKTSSSKEMLKHWKWNGRKRNGFHFDTNHLIYVSKRRVPNGPDPIHNRRAVKTRQPPSA